MVEVFARFATDAHAITAALLALLENADPELLAGVLRLAGWDDLAAQAAGRIRAEFPLAAAPDLPLGGLETPGGLVLVAGRTPDGPWDPAALAAAARQSEGALAFLAVAPDERLAPELAALGQASQVTWEELDRYLARAGERYPADSRTGFLLEQFRHTLPRVGLGYFTGFAPELLAAAWPAAQQLRELQQNLDDFYHHLFTTLAAELPGLAEKRRAGAEDLLAGAPYRDFAPPEWGDAAFLRLAMELPQPALLCACWVLPLSRVGAGDRPERDLHAALKQALTGAGLQRLQALPEASLWLWSTDGERRYAATQITPATVAETPDEEWAAFDAGLQCPVPDLTAPGIVGRSAAILLELARVLI